MAKKVICLLLAIGAYLVILAACSSSDEAPPPDYTGSCSTLASRCHGLESTRAEECHELGHAGDTSKCGPRLEECLSVCPEQEGGKPLPFDDGGNKLGDAGTADGDAGPDPTCVAYCGCMKTSCSSVSNYPFTDESVCYGACATYSASERACFTGFCQQAVDAGVRAHVCDHATGKLGTIECP